MSIESMLPSWAIIKWLIGGMAALIASLGALVWTNQAKTITKLQDEVSKMAAKSQHYVTKEHLEDMRRDMKADLKDMRTAISDHNSAVTGRLDAMMIAVLDRNKKEKGE